MVVVSIPFPKAFAVVGHKFETIDPFGTFPSVEFGYYKAQGPTVVSREGFAIATVGKDDVVAEEIDQGEVCGVSSVGVYHNIFGVALDANVFNEFSDGNACPGVVELGPAGDAVKVCGEIDLG
jgi:hypothetical protein